jgi:hypothetical protein
MLFREIIYIYCDNHTKHINTLCGKNAESFNVKAGGTHSALTHGIKTTVRFSCRLSIVLYE